MTSQIELILVIASVLLLISVFTSKLSDWFGIPTLLLFLVLGMLAGSDGPGGIYFDNAAVAQFIGVSALVVILFSGGLDTRWESIRPVMGPGVALSTLGVMVTAIIVGGAAVIFLGFPPFVGLLLGSIGSSTDAAAVFSVLRAKGVSLKGKLRPLLELESGSNDPMAVFLTISMIQLLTSPDLSPLQLIPRFILQMTIGAVFGYIMGHVTTLLINRLRLGYEGLYPVLAFAMIFFTYSLANLARGNGFLAVYIAGIVMGNRDFIHKRSLMHFSDGLAWLMQIVMFLTLGLLVFPSRLNLIAGQGLLIATILLLLARPLAVYISLLLSKLSFTEKTFVAWIGLRGAAPIILATYPLLAGIPQAEQIFNIVFFVVLTSILLQGPSIPFVARWLKLDAPKQPERSYPIVFNQDSQFRSQLKELPILPGSPFAGKSIVELRLPPEFLVILIGRENDFMIPSGGTILHRDDVLLVLSDQETFDHVHALANSARSLSEA